MSSVTVKAEFLGGLDAIFAGNKEEKITLSAKATDYTVKDLLTYIVDNLLKDPKDYDVFIEDGSVRPGILVLINDTDWELEGEDDYELQEGDVITFTSTLHGG